MKPVGSQQKQFQLQPFQDTDLFTITENEDKLEQEHKTEIAERELQDLSPVILQEIQLDTIGVDVRGQAASVNAGAPLNCPVVLNACLSTTGLADTGAGC